MSQSICILHGVNEGPATSKTLVAACEQAGLTVVKDPSKADIIFAHSGGCFLVPASHQAQLVLQVGFTYWPGRPLVLRTIIKSWREWKLHREQHQLGIWLHKWTNYARYFFNFKDVLRMARNVSFDRPWNGSGHQFIIRNHYDAYCTPAVANAPFKGPRTFISVPGEHDDCWDNPEPYVTLVQLLSNEA